MTEDWRIEAACRESDPRLFDSIDDEERRRSGPHPTAHIRIQQAFAVCGWCPVRADCRQWAKQAGMVGVWGGEYLKQSDSGPSPASQRGRKRAAA